MRCGALFGTLWSHVILEAPRITCCTVARGALWVLTRGDQAARTGRE